MTNQTKSATCGEETAADTQDAPEALLLEAYNAAFAADKEARAAADEARDAADAARDAADAARATYLACADRLMDAAREVEAPAEAALDDLEAARGR